MNFTHLHTHSAFSIQDGVARIKDYIEKLKENKQNAMALTEHGNMYSHINFYTAAKEAGIKPILGVEFYLADDHTIKSLVRTKKEKQNASLEFTDNNNEKSKKRNFHLTVIAKNNQGYKNLIKLVSTANQHGFYYKPRIDKKLLRQYREGLICLSGCLGGEINQSILNDEFDNTDSLIREYLDIFGKDFYLEVMNHQDPGEDKILSIIPKFAKKYDIKIVATNDAHYANKEDALVQNAIIAMRDHTVLNDPGLKKYHSDNYYLKSTQEMAEMFPGNIEYLENAFELGERCDIGEIKNSKVAFPEFVKGKENKEKTLRDICIRGWDEKIKPNINFPGDKKTFGDRVKYELDVINNNGFTDYFLIVQDIVKYAKSKDIPVGLGRGSVGGSLIAYLLDITELNPFEYDLYFERFLNSERISPPDIDLDFADNRRDEVIEYTKERYGKDKVVKVITYTNFKPRMALRDSFRVYGYDIELQNKVSKLVPDVIEGESTITLKMSYEDSEELAKYKEQYPEVFWLAEKLEGNPRSVSTHASAYIVCDKDITEYAPLDYDAKNQELRLGIDMYSAEYINLLKIDFLGVETLTLMDNTIRRIKERYKEIIIPKKIKEDDKDTWKIFQNGDTIGIFQFESEGMRDLLKRSKPENINHLADCNAIFRPGAAKFIPQYIDVKTGKKEAEYFHPLMRPVLHNTFGIMIMQEQVMKMCQVIAGFSLGEADLMRRAIGKKKRKEIDALKPKFAEGCKKNGIDEILVERILEWFDEMCRYNFNKSHAVAYAKSAYRQAYLKAHYPLEFYLSFMNKKIKELGEYRDRAIDAKKHKIKVVGPNINKSHSNFEIVDTVDGYDIKKGEKKSSRIYFGLNCINGVSSGTVESILLERDLGGEFKDYKDFIYRTKEFIDKKTIEGLIYSGAMDPLKVNRKACIDRLEAILKALKKAKTIDKDQLGLFGEETLELDARLFDFKNTLDFNIDDILEKEKEYTGMYCSGSPLGKFSEQLLSEDLIYTSQVSSKTNGDFVKIGCIIKNSRIFKDKNGNDMAFFEGEDDYGKIKMVSFTSNYTKNRAKIKDKNIVTITGRVNGGSVIVEKIDTMKV